LKRFIFTLSLLHLFIYIVCAQNGVRCLYEHPKVIPASYQLFYNTDSITNFDVSSEKLSKKLELKYIINYKQQIKYMAESGLIYFNWQPVDSYLNDLLFKLTPDSLKNKIKAKVFVKKEIANNAVSMPNGHIYINVGLLANLKSEAALAFIIAHELGHYLMHHHIKNYKQTLLIDNNKDADYYRFTHNNKHLEIEADEIALDLLRQQNIPIDDAVSVFQLLQKKGKVSNLNSMRLYFIEKQVNKATKKQTQKEINSQFNEVNFVCKNEHLNVLLEKKYYISCIQLGLSALDENDFFSPAYFTSEAIRRYLLSHPNNESETIEDLFLDTNKEPINFVDSISTSFLKKKLSTVFKELTSIEYKAHCQELYFTNALYQLKQTKNVTLAKADFKNYLSKENVMYNSFATSLLNDDQTIQIEDSIKPIILIDVLNSLKQDVSGFEIDFERRNQLNETLISKLKQWLFAKYSGSKIIFIEDLIEADFNTAIKLQHFFSSQDTTLKDKAYESVLFLQPHSYKLLNSLGAKSIQYFKIETIEGLQQKNENVFNPINLPAKLAYLINEKHQFSIIDINLQTNENCNFNKNKYKGKIKLSKTINALEQLID